MIRILTEQEHIAFNMNDYDQELKLASVLSFHLKHKTGKKIRIVCDCGTFMFDPADIVELTVESRRVEIPVLEIIEKMTAILDKGDNDAHA